MSDVPVFPLDTRYAYLAADLYWLPKFEYMWSSKKLASLDPRPGQPGYFAVLVRVSTELNITNRHYLQSVVNQGQALFRQLGVTNDQMTSARMSLKKHLEQRQESIEETWNGVLMDLGLPLLEQEWYPELIESRNTTAEMTAYKDANSDWIDKMNDVLSVLSKRIMEHNAALDLDGLALAIKQRVKLVAATFANDFTFLYESLGEKCTEFVAFERGLSKIIPAVAHAPTSAPSGLGRNARFGTVPCADIIPCFQVGDELYFGIIVPQDDRGASKMLGGKCDPEYAVAEDGRLCVTVDDTNATVLKEFMEETGADKDSFIVSSKQLELLGRFVPNWRAELESLGCIFSSHKNKSGMRGTRSRAARETIEATIKRKIQPVLSDIVPDNRTTKNAGYSTTLYEAQMDLQEPRVLALILTLGGGSDAAEFGFFPAREIAMQSTHKELFARYLENTKQGITRC